MNIDNDKHFDFSLSHTHTPLPQDVTDIPRPKISTAPRAPKKTRLKRLHLNGATSTVMRAIKKIRVKLLPEFFEQTCDRLPQETAIICGSSQLTYEELDQRANRLAHFLISCGVEKGNPIGILLDRSLDTYIALLGVLKAGAAFVPLDPSCPSEQMVFIAKDVGLRGLVTTSVFRTKTSVLPCPVIELDQAYEVISQQDETRPQLRVEPTSLCYITYTSSAAGRLNGIAVSHANIVNFLHVATPIYGITRHDRVYQGMSTAIDFSIEEIWPTWIAGATLVAGPTDARRFGLGLAAFLSQHKITVLRCVPKLLAAIERDVPSLRAILVGDEVCPIDLVRRWSRPGRRMLNTYGPPETTITATWCELFPDRPIAIGTPLPTYYVYVLDEQLRAVEDGRSGEICIGGSGVTSGYLNRPDLTKERFVSNPVGRDQEMVPRLYRTGDRGRITPSGDIEYLGQIDTQVTSRGYRAELGGIEQMALSQINPASLNGYAPAPPFGARAISEPKTETSKPGLLKQINVKTIYMHIMTDPLYKNSIFNMASTFILGGLGFVFWIIIARLYKTEDVGIATTLISIMTLLNNLTVMGLNSSLNRYLPKSTDKNELISSSFVIVTLVTFAASIIFLLELHIFSPQLLFLQSNFFYLISFILFVIFYSWNMLVESTFMALRAAGNILIKNTIISCLKIVIPFALVAFGAYGIFASTASAFAFGVLFSLTILVFRFKIRLSISVNVSLLKETLSYSFANYLVSFMFNMPSLVLPIIILNVLSAKYAAYYYIASMIQSILLVIPVATAQALLTEGSYNEAELKKHVKKAMVTISAILIPATAIIVFAGNILLQFFGKSYASEAFQFLQLYSISTIFTALLLIANAIMNVKHQIKLLVVLNVLIALLTLFLSYAFISNKLLGIGWGWLIGQVIAGLIAITFIVRSLYGGDRVRASTTC
ncbi:amino acid adenylation domain-containing protein [Ktedonobacteria bacterium brp13]|nr:amino acid adenylation domain-containing protein [Ktedonobacteria bacterium brp13]